MIKLKKVLLIGLIFISFANFAEDEYSSSTTPPPETANTEKYLKYLGAYLGYDLETEVTPIDEMIDYTLSTISTGQQILNAFFAAIPVNSLYKDFTTNTLYDSFNAQANILFQNYTNANSTSNPAVTENFDQQTYQSDPVSQSILNIVGTPDWSVCSNSSSSTPCLSYDQIMTTVLQDITTNDRLPGETSYFLYDNNAKFISQLNSNNLIAPLVFDSSSSDEGSAGLPNATQEQQAQNFIRYATEQVLPIPTMTQSDYSTLFAAAYPADESTADATKTMSAKVGLAQYLLSLRVYAAKVSVVSSNLYSIFSKRIPQSSSGSTGSSTTSSEALNEFKMATWRLYNPEQQSSDQWATKISTASPATIQKEMAVMMSEMLYEMHLARKDNERILLTESMILMEMLASRKPNTDLPGDVEPNS
jgi:intracellular multiplication protein IcmX